MGHPGPDTDNLNEAWVRCHSPRQPLWPSPVLTPAQVWEGLRRKVCHADQFGPGPPITSCVVKKEDNNVVHRRVVFEGGKEMTEVCMELARRRVDFRLQDGSEIENILPPGPSGELSPTYALKWKFADIEEGCEEEQNLREEQQR
ncbi:hypothetical protein MY5147_001914 [Beauveria neobassiana]